MYHSYKLSIIYKTRRKMDELRTELSQRQNGHTPSSSSEHSPTLRGRDSTDGEHVNLHTLVQQQNGHTPSSSSEHSSISRGRDSIDGDLANNLCNVPVQQQNGHTFNSSLEHSPTSRGRDNTDGDLVNLHTLNGHTPSSSPEPSPLSGGRESNTLVRRPPLTSVLRGTHWYHDMETGICSFNNY